MAAPAKLTRRRENRLLELIATGVTLAEASRAIEVSRKTIYKHARADAVFAELLRDARESRASTMVETELPDWRAIARQLEAEHPERWSLPDDGATIVPPFDFDPLA
jgi:hypothetical protein